MWTIWYTIWYIATMNRKWEKDYRRVPVTIITLYCLVVGAGAYQKMIQLIYLENMTTMLNKYLLPLDPAHVVWVNESWPSLSPCSPHRHWRHSDTLKICPDTQSRAYRREEEGAERVGSGRSPLNSCSGSRLLWKRESLWVNDVTIFCVCRDLLLHSKKVRNICTQTVMFIHLFYNVH